MYIIIIFVLMFLSILLKTYISTKRVKSWDPFKVWAMTTIVKRKDGTTFKRPFKRLEYVGQETEKGVVVGIYFVRTKPKSKKELKYEALVKKWK